MKDGKGGVDALSHFSLLGYEADCGFPESTPNYLDNICRLGLAEIPAIFQYTSPGVYTELENHPTVLALKEEVEKADRAFRVQMQGLRVTNLGKLFCKACVQQAI